MNQPVTKTSRSPKSTPITDDYEISNKVLGLGINGKVVQCFTKTSKEKHALKVSIFPFRYRKFVSSFYFSFQ